MAGWCLVRLCGRSASEPSPADGRIVRVVWNVALTGDVGLALFGTPSLLENGRTVLPSRLALRTGIVPSLPELVRLAVALVSDGRLRPSRGLDEVAPSGSALVFVLFWMELGALYTLGLGSSLGSLRSRWLGIGGRPSDSRLDECSRDGGKVPRA